MAGAKKRVVPLLPLRDLIVFPHMVSQLFVGRERSVSALNAANSQDQLIFLVAQKNEEINEPKMDDLFQIGTLGLVRQAAELPDGTMQVLVEGVQRAQIERFIESQDFLQVELRILDEPAARSVEVEALMRSVQGTFEEYVKLNKKVQPDVLLTVQRLDEPSRLSDAISANIPSVKLASRQAILEVINPIDRLEKLNELLLSELEILQIERRIRSRVKKQMDRTQKEYYLNEQMNAIQKELGGGDRDEFKSEMLEYEEQLKSKKLSEEAEEKVRKELRKLKMMHPTSAEATVVRNYVDWILSLPWGEKSEENLDLAEAERVLDEDHYGLKKIKERILEHLAVQALTRQLKGPVLCFVGPPGVGKTTLAKSIARATGRKFGRLALGGVRDEAEIRGHRRTYIGAMPGKIVQTLKKVGANNPVILLDEVDKMAQDFRGDPAAALLEVLDSEQNHSFGDHYLDIDYDLSDVMFITTANTLSGIPVPLQDRMEVIKLSGYTEFEKMNIAVKYLLPRQIQECGLSETNVVVEDTALRTLIHHYTREAGLRSLEREVSSICRKLARKVLEQRKESSQSEGATMLKELRVTARDLPSYLGVPKYSVGRKEEQDEIGLTNGLSVSGEGAGELLPCEVAVVPGKGKLVITGLLEKGMEESAQAAMSYVRSRAGMLGLDPEFYSKLDVHVHFPEFVRKDGPSAGVTMATSLASALTKWPVRKDVAMTGELTLRGRVMPIGGLKEKLLAAHRSGITTVVIPRENRKDLKEVPARVLRALRLVLAEHMDEVLREALVVAEPDAVFGPRRERIEIRDGALQVIPAQSDVRSQRPAAIATGNA